jgi:hypothetical protein
MHWSTFRRQWWFWNWNYLPKSFGKQQQTWTWFRRNKKDYNNNGYDDNAIKLAALYQWVWNIDGGFNWYAGVGGGVGTFGRDYYDNRNYKWSICFAAGDIGIEYNFDIPLLISLDFRPEFGGNGITETITVLILLWVLNTNSSIIVYKKMPLEIVAFFYNNSF